MIQGVLAKTKKGLLVAALAVCGVAAGMPSHASASLTDYRSKRSDYAEIYVRKDHYQDQEVDAYAKATNISGQSRFYEVNLLHNNASGTMVVAKTQTGTAAVGGIVKTGKYRATNQKFVGRCITHGGSSITTPALDSVSATLPK